MNISRIAAKLSQLEGTSAKIKLGGKQMMELAKKSDEPAVAEALQKALSKYPKAQAEVAYKVSEQGFTVGAVEIKNGKEVIGRGAASVTGFGTETPIAKMRLNIGKNGEVYTGSSYVDLGKTPKIEDLEYALSVKKGVITTEANAGDFIGGYQRLDTKKAAEMFGLEKIGAEVLDEGNNVLKEMIKKLRKIVSGKEEMVEAKASTDKNVLEVLEKLSSSKKEMLTDKEILELKKVALKQNQEFKKNMEACNKSVSEAFAGKAGTGKKSVSEALKEVWNVKKVDSAKFLEELDKIAKASSKKS